MAQTGETKWVVTAGIPNVSEAGETVWQITAGIPSAYTVAAGGVTNPIISKNGIHSTIFGGQIING